MHGTHLAETPRAGAEPWPLRRVTSAYDSLIVVFQKPESVNLPGPARGLSDRLFIDCSTIVKDEII